MAAYKLINYSKELRFYNRHSPVEAPDLKKGVNGAIGAFTDPREVRELRELRDDIKAGTIKATPAAQAWLDDRIARGPDGFGQQLRNTVKPTFWGLAVTSAIDVFFFGSAPLSTAAVAAGCTFGVSYGLIRD